ncbi:hypothetical protein H5410_015580 [Solanum commersonii]|uniref:Uncharacterized protein n=1 Tax=Solanum commersonii TaxID=4109 RepID=A0A9J5ZUU9_SOLCO|nr:hypothetical protein H5410_015580 [Solanum commersonii]
MAEVAGFSSQIWMNLTFLPSYPGPFQVIPKLRLFLRIQPTSTVVSDSLPFEARIAKPDEEILPTLFTLHNLFCSGSKSKFKEKFVVSHFVFKGKAPTRHIPLSAFQERVMLYNSEVELKSEVEISSCLLVHYSDFDLPHITLILQLSTALLKALHLRCKDFVSNIEQILLDARNIYSKLSKLALALEKNLLVTSTLTISSDPYTIQNAVTEAGTETETETETKGSPVESNGVEPITSAGDADEVMAEVEEAEVEDVTTVDMDTIEAIVRSSEAADTTPTRDS